MRLYKNTWIKHSKLVNRKAIKCFLAKPAFGGIPSFWTAVSTTTLVPHLPPLQPWRRDTYQIQPPESGEAAASHVKASLFPKWHCLIESLVLKLFQSWWRKIVMQLFLIRRNHIRYSADSVFSIRSFRYKYQLKYVGIKSTSYFL